MTNRPKVFITRRIPDEVLSKIASQCEVRQWDYVDEPVPVHVLAREIMAVDGLFCLLTESIDRALLESASNLRVVSTMSVGYNHIDIECAAERGIVVTNTPGVLTESTADLTFALLLSTARRLVEATDYLRQGNWQTWSPMLLTGQEVHGSTLGIIGLGRIGEAVAKRASGFDMNVQYYSRTQKPEAEQRLNIKYKDFCTLLQTSDFICVMTPNTPETANLIAYDELRQMKRSAVLINTARGGIVNENDLYRALREGLIWGAGLDVFENEPIPPTHPLTQLPNVVTLPHIGSATQKTRLQMAHLAAENLLTVLKGGTSKNTCNKPSPNMP